METKNDSEGEVPFPRRVQRRRTKGWRMPPNTVSVCRPGRWGNPFRIGGYYMLGDPDTAAHIRMSWCEARSKEVADRHPGKFIHVSDAATAVDLFKRLCDMGYYYSEKEIRTLRGKNLACYCRLGNPCHADVLLSLANAKTEASPDEL